MVTNKGKTDLRFNQLCLEDIIARIPQHVFWKDVHFVYQGCNQNFAHIAGLTCSDDIIGKTDYDLPWSNTYADIYRQEDEQLITTGEAILDKEVKLLTAKGENRVILVSKVPLYDADNVIIGIICISIDITEKKQLEKQKTAFLNIVSHEIRGPLTNIQGLAHLLEMKKKSTEGDITEIASNLIEEVKRATNLLSDIVDLYNPNYTNDDIYDIAGVNLNELIETIVPEIDFKSAIKFTAEISANVPHQININVIKLRNILKILLQNSAEQTQHGFIKLLVNTIKISDIPALYIELIDTSSSIYPENREFIFNALGIDTPVDKNFIYHKPHVKLTMAKRLINSMGGSIDLITLQKGIELEITIPYQMIYEKKPILLKIPSKNQPVKSSEIKIPLGLNVLIVEDDKTTNQLLTRIFKKFDCKVIQTYTGHEALSILNDQKNVFDIISIDITLPDINGTQVLKRITSSKLPVIVAISSHATKTDIDYFYEQGFMAVLPKPINHEDIKEFLLAYARMLQGD